MNNGISPKKEKTIFVRKKKLVFYSESNAITSKIMEKQVPKITAFSLRYGLILGGISVVFGMMLYLQNLHIDSNPVFMIAGVVFMAMVIFWGIINFKKANEGFLTLGQALKMGAGIALISALIGILYNLILIYYIDPETPSKIMEARLEPILKSGQITQEQFDQQKAQSVKYWWMGYPVVLVLNSFVGLILGWVTGAFLKKVQPAT